MPGGSVAIAGQHILPVYGVNGAMGERVNHLLARFSSLVREGGLESLCVVAARCPCAVDKPPVRVSLIRARCADLPLAALSGECHLSQWRRAVRVLALTLSPFFFERCLFNP